MLCLIEFNVHYNFCHTNSPLIYDLIFYLDVDYIVII
jgi:hypothetical protein